MKSFLKVLGGILVGALLLGGMVSGSPVAYALAGIIALFLLLSARKRKKAEEMPGSDAASARSAAAPRFMSTAEFLKTPPTCYVAFDLETTGLSAQQDAIIEIGAVYVEDGRVVRSFSQLVNPGRPIPEEASNVNHITDKMVKRCPKIGPVLQDFAAFVRGAPVLAAHNVSFDAGFLLAAAAREGASIVPLFFDTLDLSRKVWPELLNHKLATVCAKIGYTPKEAHRAEADAQAVHEIMQAALRDYQIIEAKKAEERAQEKQRREQETLDAIRITATDRAMFANRCPLSDVLPADDYASVQKGMDYWTQGDALKRISNFEDALLLYNKARYYGYNAPALYESFAVAFRKMGRLQDEVDILNECLARNPNWKNEKIAARRDRAAELLNKAKS